MSVEREMSLSEWCAKLPSQHIVNRELAELTKQLAALAEQYEKLRKVLLRLACLGNGDQYGNSIGNCIAQEALSLPDLASPALNRIRAEGMEEAAKFIEHQRNDIPATGYEFAAAIRARAAELEASSHD